MVDRFKLFKQLRVLIFESINFSKYREGQLLKALTETNSEQIVLQNAELQNAELQNAENTKCRITKRRLQNVESYKR